MTRRLDNPAVYPTVTLPIPLFCENMWMARNPVKTKGLPNPPFRTTCITLVIKDLVLSCRYPQTSETQFSEVPSSVDIQEAVERYLYNLAATRRPATVSRATQILRGFTRVFYAQDPATLTAADITEYIRALKVGNRTKFNHQIRIEAMLRYHGIILKTSKPRYISPLPAVYQQHELNMLYVVCDIRQLALFKTLLMTGIRMQEAKWLEWTDLAGGMLHIRPKPPNFLPKTHEERRIPMPAALVSLLNQIPRRPGTLVFPTAKGTPDAHMLRHLKRLAKRAGLDEKKWSLHGFRRTFCTTCLRAGLDVRTVMVLMGHSDIESTLRYWRPLEMEQLRNRMGDIFKQ